MEKVEKQPKLTPAQKEVVKAMRQNPLLRYHTSTHYAVGAGNAQLFSRRVVKNLEKLEIIERPEFSSCYSLTELGKTIEL